MINICKGTKDCLPKDSYKWQIVRDVANNITERYKLAISIFRKNYKNDPIRLLGFRLADLTEQNDYQMSLFDQDEVKTSSDTVQATIDNINKKFGKSIVAPASIKLISKKSKEK